MGLWIVSLWEEGKWKFGEQMGKSLGSFASYIPFIPTFSLLQVFSTHLEYFSKLSEINLFLFSSQTQVDFKAGAKV